MLRHRNIFTSFSNFQRHGALFSSRHILVRPGLAESFSRCRSRWNNSWGGDDSSPSPLCRPLDSSLKAAQQNREISNGRVQLQQKGMDKSSTSSCRVNEDDSAHHAKQSNMKILAAVLLAAGAAYTLWRIGPVSEVTKDEADKSVKERDKKIAVKVPASASEIPSTIPYLLIGGGTASFSAFRSIKSLDPKAKVLVVSNENHLPYMRPPLSKEMWFNLDSNSIKDLTFRQWNGAERSLLYEPGDFYISCKDLQSSMNGGVAVAQGWKVEKIDPLNRIAFLDGGHQIKYDKCLVATGSKPKNLDLLAETSSEVQKHVMLFRGISDFLNLQSQIKDIESVAVIGGGFLGSELACALARKAKTENLKLHVYQIFKEPGNMHRVLPKYLSLWTTKKVTEEGVEVIANTKVQGASKDEERVKLLLSDGNEISVSKVIVAVGVEPNTDLAEKSGLEVDPENGGFLVNAELEARSNLYAAGDCSCFYDVKFGRRRVEHHDHAVVSGRLAGENMVGAGKPYLHQSMFWSDLGPEVGYEAIGIVDSRLPTVGVFAKASENNSNLSDKENQLKDISSTDKPNLMIQAVKDNADLTDYGKGVIFYLRNEIVVGVLLWNLYSRMSVARQILMDNKKYDDLNEVAKLFNIFD